MPVQIGAKTHSFAEPTGLLSDCHRRIEMFLGSLERVGRVLEQPLAPEVRAALEAALRYFRDAAPKHTADEEESLFPRLRKIHQAEVEAVLEKLEPLEQEHRRADSLHLEVDKVGRRCLEQGQLSAPDAKRYREALAELASIYKEHIRIEDEVVFPVAGRVLSQGDRSAIAREMDARRR